MEFIRSWNFHTLPGVGIPDVLGRSTSRAVSIHPPSIPDVDDAVAAHVSQGGQLSSMVYGTDPIFEYPALQTLRDCDFRLIFPSAEQVFEDILHNDGILFQ